MTDGTKVWWAWNTAKAYSCRPSDLLGLSAPIAAYYFDKAVATFGMLVEAEIEQARKKHKSERGQAMAVNMVVHRWTRQGRFAS